MERTILDGRATIIPADDGNCTISITDNGEASVCMIVGGKCHPLDVIEDAGDFGVCVTVCDEQPPFPTYGGPYLVVPMAFNDQTLYTENKITTQNITVTEIPYTEVSNVFGGTTVSIG